METLYFTLAGISIFIWLLSASQDAGQQRRLKAGTHTYSRDCSRIITKEERKLEDEEYELSEENTDYEVWGHN